MLILFPSPSSNIQIGADFVNHMPFSDPGKVYDPDQTVQNVTFENLTIGGNKVLTAADGMFNIGPNSKNIVFN